MSPPTPRCQTSGLRTREKINVGSLTRHVCGHVQWGPKKHIHCIRTKTGLRMRASLGSTILSNTICISQVQPVGGNIRFVGRDWLRGLGQAKQVQRQKTGQSPWHGLTLVLIGEPSSSVTRALPLSESGPSRLPRMTSLLQINRQWTSITSAKYLSSIPDTGVRLRNGGW